MKKKPEDKKTEKSEKLMKEIKKSFKRAGFEIVDSRIDVQEPTTAAA